MVEKSESLRITLVEEVSRIKDEHVYPDLGRAFQHWSAVNVLGLEDKDVGDELDGAMGSDGGIDYFHVNDNNKTVEIIQAKFSEGGNGYVEQKDILEFYDIPRKLLFDGASQGSNFSKQQQLYREHKEKKYATRLIFVTTASLSEHVRNTVTSKNQNMSSDTTFEYLELKDLIAYVGNPRSPPCEINVIKNECFIGSPNGTDVRRMVSTVAASELKKACDTVGKPTLFSLNPRSFLGHKKISKSIKETIEKKPERLWYYNNGISAICDHFEYDEKTGTVRIENLKVVNGCQTMTTIAGMNEIDLKAGLVLRLTETKDTEFSENISKHTNQQNSIKSPDLSSNHPHLIRLEKRFKNYDKFFFERKKGQESGVHSKKDLYVIKNVDAARLKMAYSLGVPHLSMQLPETAIFAHGSDASEESRLFSDLYKDADPRDFIIPHVFSYLFSAIKKHVGKNGAGMDDDDRKDMAFLLRYKIGQYYVIGLIGKIFSSMSDDRRDLIVNGIVDAAIRCAPDVMDKILEEVMKLVIWIAHEMPAIVGENTDRPLHEQEVYYLRDPLRRDNKLPALYHKREGVSKYTGGHDLFVTNLSAILGIEGSRKNEQYTGK